jgi:hypothetical protein
MSISIYYKATRDVPLSDSEKKTIDGLVAEYSVDAEIEKYLKTGEGLNWESFSFIPSKEPQVILSGSTKLPNNTPDADWIAVQHWCKLLSAIRRAVPEATWNVRVQNHRMHWDANALCYDPTK